LGVLAAGAACAAHVPLEPPARRLVTGAARAAYTPLQPPMRCSPPALSHASACTPPLVAPHPWRRRYSEQVRTRRRRLGGVAAVGDYDGG
jgi:hypothetical protein